MDLDALSVSTTSLSYLELSRLIIKAGNYSIQAYWVSRILVWIIGEDQS